jgi:hypothetical protein
MSFQSEPNRIGEFLKETAAMAQWNTVATKLVADLNRDLRKRTLPLVSGGHFKAVIEDDSVLLVVEDHLGLRDQNDRVVLEKEELSDAQRAWEHSPESYWIHIDDEVDNYLEEVFLKEVFVC